MRFRFSKRAEIDIEEIADFIARDSPSQAVAYVRKLREHCRQLVQFPEASPIRTEFGEDVRMAIFDRYLIFYVIHPDVLEIRRIVHGARNIAALVDSAD